MRNYGVVPSRGGWRARPRVRRWHLLQPLGLGLIEAALPEVRLRSQREFGAAGGSAEAAAAPQGSPCSGTCLVEQVLVSGSPLQESSRTRSASASFDSAE